MLASARRSALAVRFSPLLAAALTAACGGAAETTPDSWGETRSTDGGKAHKKLEAGKLTAQDSDSNACTVGMTRPCYDGPAGTEGVGACHAGVETCVQSGELGGEFGACEGEVVPSSTNGGCVAVTSPACADGATRACTTPSGAGTEVCSAGVWSSCAPMRDGGTTRPSGPPDAGPPPSTDGGSIEPIVDLDAQNDFTVALTASGRVFWWGSPPDLYAMMTPREVTGFSGRVTAIATWIYGGCAAVEGTSVECWGTVPTACTATLNCSNAVVSQPTAVSGLTSVVALGAAFDHICAVEGGGTVACWGNDYSADLGVAAQPPPLNAVAVPGISGAQAVAGDLGYSCALLSDGTVSCWGAPGSLVSSPLTDAGGPTPVPGLTGIRQLSGGCVVTRSGQLQCWDEQALMTLPTPSAAVQAFGNEWAGVGVMADGTAVLWGSPGTRGGGLDGGEGTWGFGSQTGWLDAGDRSTLGVVPGLTDAVKVVGGGAMACALRKGGDVVCWGDNRDGELGNGTGISSTTPVTVAL